MDGEILALLDPIKYVSTRPSMNPAFRRALDAEYRKAVYLSDFAYNVNVGNTGSAAATSSVMAMPRHRLDLDVNQLRFKYHHLFSSEHVFAYRLASMVEHFKMTEQQNIVEILSEKVNKNK